MLIRVRYSDNRYDMVKSWLLDELIVSNRIRAFQRSTGWAVLDKDRIRGMGGSYTGPERRNKKASYYRKSGT